jgi:Ca2+-binding RTX toxin-like protein
VLHVTECHHQSDIRMSRQITGRHTMFEGEGDTRSRPVSNRRSVMNQRRTLSVIGGLAASVLLGSAIPVNLAHGQVSDGAGRAARCAGAAATIVVMADSPKVVHGTKHRDVIVIEDSGHVIRSHHGRDIICGSGGHDRVHAGYGRDYVYARRGADIVKGGPGGDHLYGGRGPDHIDGGSGIDRCHGGAGHDIVHQGHHGGHHGGHTPH